MAFGVGMSVSIGLFMSIMLIARLGSSDDTPKPLLVVDLMNWSEQKKLPILSEKSIPKKPRKLEKAKPIEPKPAPSKIADIQKPLQPADKIVNQENIPKPIKSIEPAPQTKPNVATNNIIEDKLPTPVPIFRLTQAPSFIHKEKPIYPATMIANGSDGLVKLEVLIDKDGRVRKIKVVKSAGDDFDNAAKTAILASSFNPAKIDKKPVAVVLRLPVRFELL